MMYVLRQYLRFFADQPLRAVLSLLTVAIGVAVLIPALTLSSELQRFVEESVTPNGIHIVVGNGRINDNGTFQPNRRSEFDEQVFAVLQAEVPGLRAVSPYLNVLWREVRVDGVDYRLRSAAGVNEQYATVANLTMVAGSFFDVRDVTDRRSVVVISETLARILFGGSEQAVGSVILNQTVMEGLRGMGSVLGLSAPGATGTGATGTGSTGSGGTTGGMGRSAAAAAGIATAARQFEVVGVYADPNDLARTAAAIPDLLVPFTSGLPVNLPIPVSALTSTIVARIGGLSAERSESLLRTVLHATYGDDIALTVWEGSPLNPGALVDSVRDSAMRFSMVVSVLGFVLLVAGCIGIFSIMVVEVLNRTREIGLRRAMGATRLSVIGEFARQSVMITGTGGLLGVVAGAVFLQPLVVVLQPYFASIGISAQDFVVPAVPVGPMVTAFFTAVVAGAVFGFFPAVAAARSAIVENVREELA